MTGFTVDISAVKQRCPFIEGIHPFIGGILKCISCFRKDIMIRNVSSDQRCCKRK